MLNHDLSLQDFARYAAVILSADERNIGTFSALQSFFKICVAFGGEPMAKLQNIKDEIIENFKEKNSQELQKALFSAFDELAREGILSAVKKSELEESFTLKAVEIRKNRPIVATLNGDTFQDKLLFLSNILSNIFDETESDLLKERLNGVKKALDERSFSIGITGVMNAGKSTLLNALLKSEILGTAVVPETANLTVLRYSPTPKAVVNFWDKAKWTDIEKSGEFLPAIAKFVKITKEKFGGGLGEFITQEGKKVEIDIDSLALYTSAAKSDLKCNLVQSVELYTDLEFLKDGVTIVDTPGLDDPVTKREEITKEYLSSCDLMIHLMNAAQSATAKDVEFIIDALVYQGISRLLVIITRIDAISEDELKEVIAYTKNSIKAQLERHNKGALFGSLIEKIEFIAVAGKLALMHRTGRAREARELGYSEERSGIFEIERYLNDTLFGAPKANLLLVSNTKILYLAVNDNIKTYAKESENLSRSIDELKNELDNLGARNAKKEQEIERLYEQINARADELKEYGDTLLSTLLARSSALQNRVFSRVFDDVKYELDKNKKKPTDERINYIIQSGLKDGIIDLVRDFRFDFSKKATAAQERVDALYGSVKLEIATASFDVKAFFAEQIGGVNLSFATLIARVLKPLAKCSKSSLEEFGESVNAAFGDEFKAINNTLREILTSLNAKLLKMFTAQNEEPLATQKAEMREEIESLEKSIKLLETHAFEARKRDEALREKLSRLGEIKAKIEEFGAANGAI